MYWMNFWWPWHKVTAVASISKKLLVCAIKWEPLIGSLQNMAAFPYIGKFSFKLRMSFFKVKNYFGHISGMVGPIDVKRKWSASVGHCVQYVTLTFDLTHDLDLGCFKVKFRNSSISGIVGLNDMKWKRGELIWYWADCMTLPFYHTYDLDLRVEISRSESEMHVALSQDRGSRLTWNEKDVSHPFMTMILTSLTMVGVVNVPDSDWGDFRRRRAVDIAS